MRDCDNKPIPCNDPLWKVAKRMPALRFAKPPAEIVSELYERYPDGVERGSFACVCSEDRFYTYHVDGQYRGQWRPICDGSIPTPSPFDISPSFLSVAYDDTSAKTIVVSAGDDSWAATTGASWATVVKTGPTTAAITLSANGGLSGRTQDIVFLWKDPDYGQPYTRTLTVVQAAKIKEPEQPNIYTEGFVYDANGLPVQGASITIERVSASGTTTLATVTSGADGKYRYVWAVSEDDYNTVTTLRVMCRKDGYEPIINTASLPSYQAAVSDGINLPDFTLAGGIEYNNIILKLKFVEEVAEEVVFDISPSTANFQYNETAARTIYVTAADNTWSAVAGDASWLIVTKNGDGTVSITPTQNSGDANRSQQVTFTWTSPLGAIYTKTLNVAQYAQGTVTGQITISGKLVDANTGAAIANVTSGQLTNLALSARDFTAPYPMSFGAVNTDSSGNFSKTFEIDSDDYANLDEFQFAVLNKVTNLFGYEDKTVTITPPAFADAVANGISFGSVALDPLPTADIVLKLKFVENEQAVTEGMIWIFGRTAVNKTLGGADYAFESGVKVDIDIDGVPIVSTTSYTDAGNGSQGHIAINFVTTEDVWNNMNMLGFRLSKDGYTGSDGKLAALLPTFEQAVLDGADVGTLYLLKR